MVTSVGAGPVAQSSEWIEIDLNEPPAQGGGEVAGVQGGPVVQALDGHAVAVADGQARADALQQTHRARDFFRGLAQPFAPMMRGIRNFFAGNPEAKRAAADLRADLSWSTHGGILDQGEVSVGMMGKLQQHAVRMGTPLSPHEISGLVAAGERIARGIANSGDGGSPLTLAGGSGVPQQVHSSVYTTRALAWYMMARGAMQDVRNERAGVADAPSAMPTNGSFIMKDPGGKIHNFLRAAPTCYERMSSHFDERSASPRVGLMGKRQQHGIEDFSNTLPGQRGTLLFDRLQGDELFVKIESVGTPSVFTAREGHEGMGSALGRVFPAIGRKIGHMFSFVQTRGNAANAATGVRQEHVYKGLLRDSVYVPVQNLVKFARANGVDFSQSAVLGHVDRGMHRLGMPAVRDALDELEHLARDQGRLGIAEIARGLRANVQTVMDGLGRQSDQYDIERRGAEVHITLDPGEA